MLKSSNDYIEKLDQVLSSKKNADVYILNDKLTLSVFAVLEKSLKNVRRIYLIIRDNPHLPKDEVAREFEMNPNDTLYNEYDIIEKNELTHFAKAKAMHDFISKYVEIRRLDPRAKAGTNILIVDEDLCEVVGIVDAQGAGGCYFWQLLLVDHCSPTHIVRFHCEVFIRVIV